MIGSPLATAPVSAPLSSWKVTRSISSGPPPSSAGSSPRPVSSASTPARYSRTTSRAGPSERILPRVEDHRPLAEGLDRAHVVGDEDERPAGADELAHPLDAAVLEGGVTDRDRLVDDEHVGLEVGGEREAEAELHPRGELLDRLLQRRADPGELDDLVEAAADVVSRQPEDPAVEHHVLAAGQLRVHAGADLDQGTDPAPDPDPPLGRERDPRHELQRGGLAGAVVADDRERLALGDLERQVVDGGDHVARRASADDRGQVVAERSVLAAAAVALRDVVERDRGRHRQTRSAKPRSRRLNNA